MRVLFLVLALLICSVNAYAFDWTTAYPGLDSPGLYKYPYPPSRGAFEIALPPGGAMTRTAGSISRASAVRAVGGALGRLAAPVAIALTIADIYRLAHERPDLYPGLADAGSHSGSTPGASAGEGSNVGDHLNIGGTDYRITAKNYLGDGCASALNSPSFYGDKYTVMVAGGNAVCTAPNPIARRVIEFTVVPETAPTVPASSPSEMEPALADPSDPSKVRSNYQNELDRMIVNNYNNPTVTYNYNQDMSQLSNSYNNYTRNAYNNSVTNNTATQQAAVDAATASVADAQARYDANPTDQNFQTLQDAKQNLQTAQTGAAQADVQQTQADQDNGPPPEPPAKDDRKSFDWSKWRQLKNIMTTVFPFSLISSLTGYVSLLVAEPVAPSFTLPLYGNEMVISLSIFDSLALICRWILSLLMVVGSIQLIIYFYRGGGQ